MPAMLIRKSYTHGLLNIALLAILSVIPTAHAETAAGARSDRATAAATPATKVSPIATQNNSLLSSDVDAKTPEYVILQPIDEATFSSETTASVEKLYVKEGSYFRTGDVLIELDCRVQKAEYQRALAQAKEADVALKSALKLKSYGSISEYELVKAMLKQKWSKLMSASLVRLLINVLSKLFQWGGFRTQIHTHETVKPGDPLIKIVNTDRIIIEMEVPSDWLQWLHINTNFNVHVNEINKTIARASFVSILN